MDVISAEGKLSRTEDSSKKTLIEQIDDKVAERELQREKSKRLEHNIVRQKSRALHENNNNITRQKSRASRYSVKRKNSRASHRYSSDEQQQQKTLLSELERRPTQKTVKTMDENSKRPTRASTRRSAREKGESLYINQIQSNHSKSTLVEKGIHYSSSDDASDNETLDIVRKKSLRANPTTSSRDEEFFRIQSRYKTQN
jgi:hypothetical protein